MPNRPPPNAQAAEPRQDVDDDSLWLCRVEDIPDGGTRGLRRRGNDDQLIAVRSDGVVRVYRNCCPHQLRPLEYRRHRFLAPDGQSLMCYAHGSRFRLEDGYCFVGACQGQSLTPVPVRVVDGDVWLVDRLVPQ